MTCIIENVVSTFFLLYVQTMPPANLGEYYTEQACKLAQAQIGVKTICVASGNTRNDPYYDDCPKKN